MSPSNRWCACHVDTAEIPSLAPPQADEGKAEAAAANLAAPKKPRGKKVQAKRASADQDEAEGHAVYDAGPTSGGGKGAPRGTRSRPAEEDETDDEEDREVSTGWANLRAPTMQVLLPISYSARDW